MSWEIGDVLVSSAAIKSWAAEDDLESFPAGTEFVYRGEVEGDPRFVKVEIGAVVLYVEKAILFLKRRIN